ncbi:DUF6318 family protein [Micrococcoides hystricis]|uniref:DUF6318 family protein n=1 Tax=Micrococcoides hystricis TaxID=1572761 RepID=A0ABV6P7F9_9MICC
MNLPKRLLSLALAVPLLFVSACGDEETPGQTPSPENSSPGSSTPPSSPSPSGQGSSPSTSGEYKPATLEHPAQNVQVPKYPETGKKDNKEGREAAARYFFEALNYVKETGKRDALDEVSHPVCELCYTYQKRIGDHYRTGGWIVDSKAHSLELQEQPEVDEHGRYRINFSVKQNPGTAVEKNDSSLEYDEQPGSLSKGTLWVQYWPKKQRVVVLHYGPTDSQPTS